MNIKRFILSYYENATSSFYITRIENPSEALKPHIHDYFQVYYVEKGSIRHHLGKNSALLCCGDVFIIPPNVKHYISKEEDDTVFYSMSFLPDFIDNLAQSHLLLADFLHSLTSVPKGKLPPKISLKANDSILTESLLARILSEFNEKKLGSEDVIKDCTSVLITLFARNHFKKEIENIPIGFETNKSSVLHCIDYISNHSNEDITLEEISRYATMSKACFCRLFSSITKMSFKEFLHSKRIEKASELLSTTDLKVSSVAAKCGYGDFTTFYRNFKKITGLSPAEFKKINRQ